MSLIDLPMRPARLSGALLVTAILPLAGCSFLQTRPGHPDSYATHYYHCEREWIRSTKCGAVPATTGPTAAQDAANAAAGATTPVFRTAKTPVEIWKARGYSWNLYLQYEAAAYKAQDVQDSYAVPLFGTAVAAAGLAISHGSTVAIAATGLGGGAVSGGYSYMHPGADATTDQTAEAALLCVVDQSKILNDMSAIPLTLDQAALQDALNHLQLDAGALLASTATANLAAKQAVQAVQAAASQTMKSLQAAIAAYVMLPSEIYQAADTISENAKTAGARTLNYAALVQSLQASATNQAATNQAQNQVQQAASTTSQAAATSPTAAANQVLQPNAAAPATTNLAAASAELGQAATAAVGATPPPASPETDSMAGTPVTSAGTAKTASLTAVVTDPTISDMTRVTELSNIALNDIPSPNFSDIAANIKACGLPK